MIRLHNRCLCIRHRAFLYTGAPKSTNSTLCSGGAKAAKCHVKCTSLGIPGDAGTVYCSRTVLQHNTPVVILLHCAHFFRPSSLSRQLSRVTPNQRVCMCHSGPFAQQLSHCLLTIRQGLQLKLRIEGLAS